MVHELLQGALPLVIAGLATPTIIGGYRWLRKLTAVVGQIADVTEQLGNVSQQQAETARLVRAVQRELRLHVIQCRSIDDRVPYPGPERRRVPRPRPEPEQLVDQDQAEQ